MDLSLDSWLRNKLQENEDIHTHENDNNANTRLAAGIRECLPDKHKQRDNKFGVTWCVKCGRLLIKPCGKPLLESDKVLWHCA